MELIYLLAMQAVGFAAIFVVAALELGMKD